MARVLKLKGLRAPSLKPDSTVPSLLRLLEVRLLPSVPDPLVPGEVLLASGLVPLGGPSPPLGVWRKPWMRTVSSSTSSTISTGVA